MQIKQNIDFLTAKFAEKMRVFPNRLTIPYDKARKFLLSIEPYHSISPVSPIVYRGMKVIFTKDIEELEVSLALD